ncbi:MarR family winged helix-turn-helix transcriptional regulator [Arcticibacterium luteifluviistationis]|uniref:MarR family transcriptional regulator n=1 Tax=Arcticibacterium luteifluviistationis TaxID=1784714 RepID=A0A2Z4GGY3_9BACT|nr:MarR family transcriptional regulator [Arcticibacterium luteifluviistationis]AWW00507.1 MarR family transcriptional regulator [Arcticibacterium luteifluviistationis]
MTLEKDIKQTKAFKNPVEKTFVNIMFTNNKICDLQYKMLKKHDLTFQQYNVLRILKGHHPKPITINGIIERMLDKMSNASRLVDKLLQKGYVNREFRADDRRACDVTITKEGLSFLENVNMNMNKEVLSRSALCEEDLEILNTLLDKFRAVYEK